MKARVLALACFALFLGRTFRAGWNTDDTDFPNYYTPAVLVRHGEPLNKYYDWAWFQRQMNFAGLEEQLGTYIPQTPLAMLPLLPMAGFPAQTAKRMWLTLSLGLLIAAVWMLSRITKFRIEHVALVLFAGYGTLQSNFYLGQYYVFLFFLVTLAFYCLEREQSAASGVVCGTIFALKLYGAPFLLCFAAKRNWKAVAGMVGAIAVAGGLATAMFGWHDVHYFLREILPRAIDGEGTGDPYHSFNGTLLALLRRSFLMEPDLNPHPMWNAPGLFFFLRPFTTLMILAFTVAGLAVKKGVLDRRGFAWFAIATLCVAPNLGHYAFILFLPPILILMKDADTRERILLVIAYALLGYPLRLEWTRAFPKLWIFLALFCIVGWPYWRALRPKVAIGLAVAVALIASLDAQRHMVSYRSEPGRRFPRIMFNLAPKSFFVSSFAVSKVGIFCQAIADSRYSLLWLHDNQTEKLSFKGEAFHPRADAQRGLIYFELVTHATSTTMAFDPATRAATPVLTASSLPENAGSASTVSPDGKWVAFEVKKPGAQEVWLRSSANDDSRLLGGGRCINASPTWELDSKALLFTSDCQRGMGLPALYRASVADE
jgi:Glycosyltransferase family 87